MSCTCLYSGLAVTYRPDGQELAVASLDGEITFWNPQTGGQTGSIAGRHDLQMGRKETEKITAKQSAKGKYVTDSYIYMCVCVCILLVSANRRH